MARKLAAILVVDVAGYSRLMGVDEEGTLATLKTHMSELIAPKITEHSGRVVKSTGDGLIAEFSSVVDAVRSAAEIQKAMPGRNAGVADESQFKLRIAINLGDIIAEGDDIFGDGVNVAARLEGLCEPGDIVLSGSAHEQVKGKLSLAFRDMGLQTLKNIVDPIRVYCIRTGAAHISSAPSLAEKPSIAVLPFENMSGDPEQQYFSDGITEDIITELGRFRSLLVISRYSSFAFQKNAVSSQAFAQTLGVQYLVEGSVRKAGNRVRVSVKLTEAQTGKRLWAERYDRDLVNIFAVQDEITQNIVSNLAGRLDNAVGERALRRGPENLSKYDLVQQGRYLLNRGTKEDILRARQLFEKALEVDRDDAQIYVGLAASYAGECQSDWTEDWRASAHKVLDLARRAVELDNQDSQAHLLLAWAYFRVRANFNLAASQVEKAIELNPNDTHNYCFKSWLLTCTGDPDGGIVCAGEALRRNPLAPNDCLWTIGYADYLAGRYDRALDAFSKMGFPRPLDVNACMAACLAQLGRREEARHEANEFLARAKSELVENPTYDAGAWRAYWLKRAPFKEGAQMDHLLDGLQRAGLPQ